MKDGRSGGEKLSALAVAQPLCGLLVRQPVPSAACVSALVAESRARASAHNLQRTHASSLMLHRVHSAVRILRGWASTVTTA